MKNKQFWLTGLVFFLLTGVAWAQAIHFQASAPTSGPNAKWCKGRVYTISWTSEGHSELIRIGLLRSQGGTSSEILVIGSDLPSNGSLDWRVPGTVATGDGYYLTFRTMAGHFGFASGPLRIETCVQVAVPQAVAKLEVSRAQLPPVHAMVFEQFEQGAIRMEPAVLTIKYGTHTVTMNQNESKTISIDEDSDLIDPVTHGLRATVEYTLHNTLAKNFRFHVTLRFGGHFYTPAPQVTFVGVSNQHVVQNVVLYPGNQTLRIVVEATDILIDGGTNDVRPVFFSGNLHVRIFPN